MTKLYRTNFCVRLVEDNRKVTRQVLVRCADDDYFFYTLLTKGKKCGILDTSVVDYAEAHFFFNGYDWIDGEPIERREATQDRT